MRPYTSLMSPGGVTPVFQNNSLIWLYDKFILLLTWMCIFVKRQVGAAVCEGGAAAFGEPSHMSDHRSWGQRS